ncbi:hypothetical protein B566_EDAN006865 [Ephemera danica]|nr:hypothetical protein B566_EDAN006865 [Ephemera danica]
MGVNLVSYFCRLFLFQVLWYRDTLRLDTTERRYSEVRGSRHTLFIRKVQSSDFGNYSCLADNTLGKSRQYLELSGRADSAVFDSLPQGRYRDSYNISWSVNSYTPVEEFKLFFRKLPDNDTFMGNHVGVGNSHSERHHMPVMGGYGRGGIGAMEWRDVIINVQRQDRLSQRVSYLIHGLEPGTDYEAKVQARNRFGWNTVSTGFRFSTRGSESSLYETPPEPAVYAGSTAISVGASSNLLSSLLLLLSDSNFMKQQVIQTLT